MDQFALYHSRLQGRLGARRCGYDERVFEFARHHLSERSEREFHGLSELTSPNRSVFQRKSSASEVDWSGARPDKAEKQRDLRSQEKLWRSCKKVERKQPLSSM